MARGGPPCPTLNRSRKPRSGTSDCGGSLATRSARSGRRYCSSPGRWTRCAGGKITLPLVVDWARSAPGGSPRYAAWRYEAVRRFLTVAACTRRETVVPPPGYLGRPFGRRSPHVYKDEEVRDLLVATAGLTPTTGLRPWTYRTLFGLLRATGLRVGEALALDCGDVDSARGTLLVRRDKSRASREIPLHPSVRLALGRYATRRDTRHPCPRSTAFFLTETRATRLQYQYVDMAFCLLRRSLGWKQSPLPTIHDLRHSFAASKFLEWMKAGKDVDAEIPALSAYRGTSGRRAPTGISRPFPSARPRHRPHRAVRGHPADEARRMRAPDASTPLARLIQRYFLQHLKLERQTSDNTIASYATTFRLLLAFCCRGRRTLSLGLADFDARMILAFLHHLEAERGCSALTRNARLAAVKSFFRYVAVHEAQDLPIAQRVFAIPTKRFDRNWSDT